MGMLLGGAMAELMRAFCHKVLLVQPLDLLAHG
jgi:hypothetical protein